MRLKTQPIPGDELKWRPVVGQWTGLRLPGRVEATWKPDKPEEPEVRMSLRLREERCEVVSVTVGQGTRDDSVTNDDLRAVAVQTLSEAAARDAVGLGELNTFLESSASRGVELKTASRDPNSVWSQTARTLVGRGLSQIPVTEGAVTGPKLILATAVYRYGAALGLPQLYLISAGFGISHSAAAFWVRRAKDRGYLRPGRSWSEPPVEEDW